MRPILFLLLSLASLIGTSQNIQFDLGTTLGSGSLAYQSTIKYGGVESSGILSKVNPSITTQDFYLAMISPLKKRWYLRSKLETINFSNTADVNYLRNCIGCPLETLPAYDTLNYNDPINRYQLALDLLIEFRFIDKARWNAYANMGVSIIKKLPNSTGLSGHPSVKYTTLVNLGTTIWLHSNLGLHLSSGYRHPSYYRLEDSLKVSLKKYYISIGLSLKIKSNENEAITP